QPRGQADQRRAGVQRRVAAHAGDLPQPAAVPRAGNPPRRQEEARPRGQRRRRHDSGRLAAVSVEPTDGGPWTAVFSRFGPLPPVHSTGSAFPIPRARVPWSSTRRHRARRRTRLALQWQRRPARRTTMIVPIKFPSDADVFAARSIRYALVGGLATLMRGRPRFTQDVDILLDVPQLALPGLLDDLAAAGFAFDAATVIREYVREHMTTLRFGSVRIDWLK